jgi:hypothetical protein
MSAILVVLEDKPALATRKGRLVMLLPRRHGPRGINFPYFRRWYQAGRFPAPTSASNRESPVHGIALDSSLPTQLANWLGDV